MSRAEGSVMGYLLCTAQDIQTLGAYASSKGDKTSRVLEGKPEKMLQESGGRADKCQQHVGIDGIVWRRQFLSWALNFMISEVSNPLTSLEQILPKNKVNGMCKSGPKPNTEHQLKTLDHLHSHSCSTIWYHHQNGLVCKVHPWAYLRPQSTIWGHHFSFTKQ